MACWNKAESSSDKGGLEGCESWSCEHPSDVVPETQLDVNDERFGLKVFEAKRMTEKDKKHTKTKKKQ